MLELLHKGNKNFKFYLVIFELFYENFICRYRYTYQDPMPVEQLVRHICDYKQAYTQYGGLRPFGVAFLFAGN